MQLSVFEEYGEEDSVELRNRLEDIRIEMEYPSVWWAWVAGEMCLVFWPELIDPLSHLV